MLATFLVGVGVGVAVIIVIQHGWGWVLARYHSAKDRL